MRDDFSEEVKRTLANRVGNDCSNPECNAKTSGPQSDSSKALNVGVASHITSAAPGGPRFDPLLTSEQRCHADNGIWLCQTCAKLIDNDVLRFPETLLRAWKMVAEHRALHNIGKAISPPVAVSESEAQRKRREILEWKGKIVTLSQMSTARMFHIVGARMGSAAVSVVDCTEFVVKIRASVQVAGDLGRSIPLDNITIGFDDAMNRLELQERYS
jgi:hypothetical protein